MYSARMTARDLLVAAAVGVIINFPWEMAQSMLYRGARGFTWAQHLACCSMAALADGVGIALIFGAGALVYRDPQWTRRRSLTTLGLTAILGLAGAVVTEWLALRLGWWGYSPEMPRLPGVNLGAIPVVQFVLLPLGVLFWAMPRWWRCQDRKG